jgi:GntR family transcriptional regulator, transcriptional repressor for pyruvate dehydrogenase complex
MDQQAFDDMSLTPGTASESAERYVRALIFWGELGRGDRLPPATELAAQLGISRVTLRIALRSLETSGYLVTTRGAYGGSRVSDAPALQRCWTQWMTDHLGELDDIFEFRVTIERRLAELAAERRTAADLEAMAEALAGEMDGRQRSSLFQADAGIHRSIAAAAHSPRLALAMNAVRADLFLPVEEDLLDSTEDDVFATHQQIVAAIREGDAERAALAAETHVLRVRELVARALEASGIPRAPDPRRTRA